MGMLDYVTFKCPHCGEIAEDQTKAGKCILKTYPLKDKEKGVKDHEFIGVLSEMKAFGLLCDKCGEMSKLKLECNYEIVT